MNKMTKKPICILSAVCLLLLAGAAAAGWLHLRKYAPQKSDFERIDAEAYTSVFFSTYPIDHFTEEDFEYYREIYPLKAAYCIPDAETMKEYFRRVFESGNEISSAYLGIRPDLITADDLISLMSEYPDRKYEIILSYPSAEYWKKLSEKEYPARLQAYADFLDALMPLDGHPEETGLQFSVYFYNDAEWLTGNPANYESRFGVNEGISHMISMYSDCYHDYMLTEENYGESLEKFEELTEGFRTQDTGIPDLSKWDIVFFGDSVIAFENTASIPDALSGLTGAHTYNCARGGSGAVKIIDHDGPVAGISEIMDAFLAKDAGFFETGSLARRGIEDYLQNAKKNRRKCFVLNFGLNDFFQGNPVGSADSQDTDTYVGALRACVVKLKDAYPDALILLMTPNFTSYFGNGTEPQSENGGALSDYADAVTALSKELDTLLLDNFHELGINGENHTLYLLDGTHPNESTRYGIARRIAELLQAR